jgi:hypothetical protein
MDRDPGRIHLAVNLMATLVAAVILVTAAWLFVQTLWFRLTLTAIIIAAAPFAAHRLTPKLTGGLLDMILSEEN